MAHVVSYQVADNIDVRAFRGGYKEGIYHYDADELFYKTGPEDFVYVFKYGVVCFLNYDVAARTAFLQRIMPYCKNVFAQPLSEEFEVETNARENKFGYNKIEIVKADIEVLRLIMLNVSQSVSLDYYSEQTNLLQEETHSHTLKLERKGRLDISGGQSEKIHRQGPESQESHCGEPLYFRFAARDLGGRRPQPDRSGSEADL